MHRKIQCIIEFTCIDTRFFLVCVCQKQLQFFFFKKKEVMQWTMKSYRLVLFLLYRFNNNSLWVQTFQFSIVNTDVLIENVYSKIIAGKVTRKHRKQVIFFKRAWLCYSIWRYIDKFTIIQLSSSARIHWLQDTTLLGQPLI